MATKPNIPVTRKEMYLDVMTGGSSSLPEPITLEEMYLAKIAGMAVDLPTPRYIKHKYLAKIAGMTVNVPTYTMNLPRIYAYLAKAAGQDFEVPQPITREEMYWFDYVNGQPTPSEQEYTGAVPVTFTADGTPLLDYLISGNAVQNGTPTPDNPIQPQECGERTGNLFLGEFSQFDNTGGTGTTYAYFALTEQCTLTAIPKEDITISGTYNLGLSGNGGNANDGISWAIAGGRTYQKGIPISITNQSMLFCSIYPKNTETLNWILEHFDIMLNLGSTALPYEPYGYKIPISSANTITPVYLGDVETTRKIRKLVLMGGQHDGNIDITPRGIICITPLRTLKNVGDAYCTHYKYVNQSQGSNMPYNSFTTRGGDDTSLWFKTEYATIADFKDYLAAQYAAGTPVTIWYVLAEPETAVINEPLMKIGDYADTLSMEQAGAEIPTINGENTLDVLTTVKPSEVYIKYKGEPVAGSQTSSQSSAYAPAEVSGQSESIDDINNGLIGKEEETE